MSAHPYADAWPMLGDDELGELAMDILANGLRQPIVTLDGLILDGRNRHAACLIAKVEPTMVEFDGTDDDALAFVQSVNGARRHQSKGSLAASWALSMLAAEKRASGRWSAYGESPDIGKSEQNARSYLGLVADECPSLLIQVRDDEITLNAAYEQAKAMKASRLALEDEARVVAEIEAEAERFVSSKAPDLAALVGTTYQTFLEAEAVWKVRNAEAAKKRDEDERRERERKAAVERGIKDALTHISNAVQFLGTDAHLFVEDTLPHRDRYSSESRYLTAEHVDAAIDYLTTIRKAL